MRWGDFGLVSDNPTFTVRAAVSKNHKRATLPLHPTVVVELARLKPDGTTDGDFAFEGLVPRSKRFNALLEAAGIPKHDTQGRVADFHSLRHTFCTYLQRAGVSQREIMELMRHSDPRLTASTYTDSRMLGLRSAIGKLSIGDSQLDSQELVATGHSGSSPVTNGGVQTSSQSVENKWDKSLPVTLGHDLSQPGAWCALQVSNLLYRRLPAGRACEVSTPADWKSAAQSRFRIGRNLRHETRLALNLFDVHARILPGAAKTQKPYSRFFGTNFFGGGASAKKPEPQRLPGLKIPKKRKNTKKMVI
jgi:hypothetical protein